VLNRNTGRASASRAVDRRVCVRTLLVSYRMHLPARMRTYSDRRPWSLVAPIDVAQGTLTKWRKRRRSSNAKRRSWWNSTESRSKRTKLRRNRRRLRYARALVISSFTLTAPDRNGVGGVLCSSPVSKQDRRSAVACRSTTRVRVTCRPPLFRCFVSLTVTMTDFHNKTEDLRVARGRQWRSMLR
jgi:hypothetical protein